MFTRDTGDDSVTATYGKGQTKRSFLMKVTKIRLATTLQMETILLAFTIIDYYLT